MLRWKPIYPTHAVERVALTVRFQALPNKPLDRVSKLLEESAERNGISQQIIIQQPGFGFDLGQDGVPRPTPLQTTGSQAYVFRQVDNGQIIFEIFANSQAIGISTVRYDGWDRFHSTAIDAISGALFYALEVVEPIDVRLEYWNQFTLSNDNDGEVLFNDASQLMGSFVAHHETSTHCHIGLFKTDASGTRRLLNVNADTNLVSDAAAYVAAAPSNNANIYLLAAAELIGADAEPRMNEALSRLCNGSHDLLKSALRDILSVAMSEKLSLNAMAFDR